MCDGWISCPVHPNSLLDCSSLLTHTSHSPTPYPNPSPPTPHPHPSPPTLHPHPSLSPLPTPLTDTLTQLVAVTTPSVSVCTLRPVFRQSSSLTFVASTASPSSTTSAAAAARPTSPPPPPTPPHCPVQGSKTKEIQLLGSECRRSCWGDRRVVT